MKRLLSLFVLCVIAASAPAADLLAVYQRALQNDPQLREAEANRLAALETKPQALAALLPQISGSGLVTREHDSGRSTITNPLQFWEVSYEGCPERPRGDHRTPAILGSL